MKLRNIISYILFLAVLATQTCFAQETLRDIQSPVEMPFDFRFLITIGLIIAAIAFLFILEFVRRKITRMREYKPQIQRTPAEIALLKLAELKHMKLLEKGKTKEYFSILSDILRNYIEAQFKIRAPEMTTEEFLEHVRWEGSVSRHLDSLTDFFKCCDMVKFAKYGPTKKESEDSFISATKFINETGKEEQALEEVKA